MPWSSSSVRLTTYLAQKQPERIWFLSAHRTPDSGFLKALQKGYSVIDDRKFFMAEDRLLARSPP
jgi:hypothetical protein